MASCSLYGKLEIREAKWGVYRNWKDVTNIIREQLQKQGGNSLTLSNESIGTAKEKFPSAARKSWQTKLFGANGSPLWGTNKTLKILYFDGASEKSVEVAQGSPLNLVSVPLKPVVDKPVAKPAPEPVVEPAKETERPVPEPQPQNKPTFTIKNTSDKPIEIVSIEEITYGGYPKRFREMVLTNSARLNILDTEPFILSQMISQLHDYYKGREKTATLKPGESITTSYRISWWTDGRTLHGPIWLSKNKIYSAQEICSRISGWLNPSGEKNKHIIINVNK